MDKEKELLKNEEITEETEEVEEEFPLIGLEKVYLCDECGTVTTELYCPHCQKAMTPEETYICKPQLEVERNKKTIKTVIIAILAVVVLAAGVLAIMHFTKKNPYNTGEYKDLAFGQTIGEVAYEEGMIYEKYLEMNGFPADMPEDTYYYVAIQYRRMFEEETFEGMSEEEINQMLQMQFSELELTDKGFTKDSLYGEVIGGVKLKYFFGVQTEEDVEMFKSMYPQFKDIQFTPETTFKEIRVDFYKAEENERLKALEPEEEMPVEETQEEIQTEETPVEEAPVEGDATVETETEVAPAA